MSLITYSQFMEDVILYRALRNIDSGDGFYVDIGGYHPTYHSVTKLFYDLGWRGINVEPGASHFPEFVTERPRDINLQVAVSDHVGEATFFEMDQTSTLEMRYTENDHQAGNKYTVPVTTLDDILDKHAPKDIHFLKIDVEGHEAAVIRGWNKQKFRPWLLAIEAFEPNRLDRPTHQEWEDMIIDGGYTFAYADILNRYYVSNERRDLLQYFGIPADDFHKSWDIWRALEVEKQRDEYERRLIEANSRLTKLGGEQA